MFRHLSYPTLLLTASLAFLASCEKTETPDLVVPDTYAFDNVDYSGQTTRLEMLTQLTNYMKTANSGATVDAALLKAMFANSGNPFGDAALDGSGKQLKDKCFELDRAYFEDWMDVMAAVSASALPAEDGQAGIGSSGSSSWVFDAQGVEPIQLIEKGLMGAVFYYQAMAVYLSDERMSADNETVTPGTGTLMEHYWDEAFGYTAMPVDFGSPYDNSALRFWARYANGRDPLLGCNEKLALAFRTGRAAISAKDYALRDEQIAIISETWEDVCAGTVVHYLNEAIVEIGDDAVRNHVLSEALAFARSLKYNPNRRISLEQLAEFEALLGDNFYQAALQDLRDARSLISGIYGFEAIEESL